MNIKDIICPYCGKPDYYSPLKKDNYLNSLELDEEIININYNENINNIFNSCCESKSNNNLKEDKNTFNNTTFSINNFNFCISTDKILSKDNSIIINEEKKKQYISEKSSKKLGRKTKKQIDSNIEDNAINNKANQKSRIHDRYCDDNIRKKCKNLILKSLLKFINDKIKIIYDNDIGYGDQEKSLKVMDQKKKKNSTVGFDRDLLDKTLKEIFSEDISARFCNYSSDHNKKIIESLINDEDEEKKSYFTKLFNIKFVECLKYFRGEQEIKELEGFKRLPSIKENLLKENEESYVNHFVYYIQNFEMLINKKGKKLGK